MCPVSRAYLPKRAARNPRKPRGTGLDLQCRTARPVERHTHKSALLKSLYQMPHVERAMRIGPARHAEPQTVNRAGENFPVARFRNQGMHSPVLECGETGQQIAVPAPQNARPKAFGHVQADTETAHPQSPEQGGQFHLYSTEHGQKIVFLPLTLGKNTLITYIGAHNRRRTQVGKGRLCKSLIHQFESDRCLLKARFRKKAGFFVIFKMLRDVYRGAVLFFAGRGMLAAGGYGCSGGGSGFLRGLPRGRFTGVPSSATAGATVLFLRASSARIFLARSSMRMRSSSATE